MNSSRIGMTLALAVLPTLLLGLYAADPERKPAGKPPYQRLLHGDDAKQAAALRARIEQLSKAGQFTEALEPAEKLYELRKRVQGADHWESVDAFHIKEAAAGFAAQTAEVQREVIAVSKNYAAAQELQQQGRYDRAEFLLRRNLIVYRQVLGEETPDTAARWNWLAANLHDQGQYARAEPYYRRSLDIYRKVLGEEHPDTAVGYNSLGYNLTAQGRHVEAESLYRKALAIDLRHLSEKHPATANACNNLAVSIDSQGRHAEAEPLFRRVLALRRQILGEHHADLVPSYSWVASNLDDQGRHLAAEPYYRKALALSRQVHGEEHRQTAYCQNNLADNLKNQGKYAEADLVYREAVALCRKVFGAEHPLTATCYDSAASNLESLGQGAAAEQLMRRSLAMRRQTVGEQHPDTAVSCHNLGHTLNAQGRFAEAEPLARQCLEIRQKMLGENHPETAGGYAVLANNLRGRGEHAEAERLYRKALAIAQKALGEQHASTAGAHGNLAGNLDDQGKHGEALVEWRAAVRSFEAARLRVSAPGLSRTPFTAHLSPYPALAANLARAGRATEAWQALESHLGRGLFEEFTDRAAAPLPPEEDRRRAQELSGQLNRLIPPVLALVRKPELSAGERDRLNGLLRQRADLEAQLADLATTAARRGITDLEHLQSRLPADAAFIAWIDIQRSHGDTDPYGAHWACVVRPRGQPVWVKFPGSRTDGAWAKDDQLLSLQLWVALAFSKGGGRELPSPDAHARLTEALYRQRLAPLVAHLGARDDLPAVRRLLIVPADRMLGVPVEVLTDRYTISYVPSGTMLARSPTRPIASETANSLLALGDPLFQSTDGKPSFAALPGTRREVEALARLSPQTETLLGSDASAQRLEQLATTDQLRRFRYLHLATHGVIDPRSPRQSALILSHGRLTVQNILDTWHLDADVATLSACRTGLGQEGGGEGFVGFSQALLLAGARSVVLSLWQVDDTATALLMMRFYENLLGRREGLATPLPKAEALREAKTWLRELTSVQVTQQVTRLPGFERGAEREGPRPAAAGAKPFAHPYYWSAFILIGDPS